MDIALMEDIPRNKKTSLDQLDSDIQELKRSIWDLIKVLPLSEGRQVIEGQMDGIACDYKELKKTIFSKDSSFEISEFSYKRIRSIYLSLKIVHENIQRKYCIYFRQPLGAISGYLNDPGREEDVSFDQKNFLFEEVLELLHDGDEEEVIRQIELVKNPEILNKLLNKNSQLDESLLMLSSEWGDNKLVRFLLNHPVMSREGINLVNEEGDSAFTLACKEGNLETLRILLSSKNVDLKKINLQRGQGKPFLHQLAERGCIETLSFLMKNSVFTFDTFNLEGESLFFSACKSEDRDLIELFVENHTKINLNQNNLKGESPLHYLCKKGLKDLVEILFSCPSINKKTLDKRRQSPFFLACQYGHKDLVELMLKDPDIDSEERNIQGVTPLKLAVWNHMEECFIKIKPELQNKMNNEKKQSKQFFSAREELCWLVKKNTYLKIFQDVYLEKFDEVEKLLNHPLDKEIISAIDTFGNSALSYLILNEKEELVKKILLHKSFTPHLLKIGNCDGKNPFYLACEVGNKNIIETLIYSGLLDHECVNQLSKSGETPLTMLCKKRDESTIESVLQLPNLDIKLSNQEGESPESLAKFQLLTNLIAFFNARDHY
jgi:ankyrin repeat protein